MSEERKPSRPSPGSPRRSPSREPWTPKRDEPLWAPDEGVEDDPVEREPLYGEFGPRANRGALLKHVESSQLRSDIPVFRPGDTLAVHVRVFEGSRSRVQVFRGIVTRRQGGGTRETFTVRKVSFGVGVERTFPVHTPVIERIEVEKRGKVRRAKLYYLRDLRGKAAKIKDRS